VAAALMGMVRERAALFVLVLAVFVAGVVVGAISISTLDGAGRQELSLALHDLLRGLAREGAVPSAGWSALVVDHVLKTAGLLWLLGLSIIGFPLIVAVVFLRGFALGFALGFLLEDLVLRGVALALVALVPQNLLIVPGLACAAVGAIAFSFGALRIVLGRPGPGNIYDYLRTEGSVVLIGAVLLFGGGLLESYLTPSITAVATRYLLGGV
jgi:stage II sporulation protein M